MTKRPAYYRIYFQAPKGKRMINEKYESEEAARKGVQEHLWFFRMCGCSYVDIVGIGANPDSGSKG